MDRRHVTIEFDLDELMLVNGALNEVCNGVNFSDAEFSTRLGADRAEALRLLERIHALWGEMGASRA
jgi:hypothetical protein